MEKSLVMFLHKLIEKLLIYTQSWVLISGQLSLPDPDVIKPTITIF
ncbi:hypothetical protein GW12_10470 [Acinetobacter sp. HR7]|nr:hypothetical protein GW12_10470 [Acinetobacter sp. HR7]